LAHLGVGCGPRVAALGVNSHRSVEAYYATALLGGVFIPLNYRAKLPELEHMLKAGRARVLLVGERYLETVRSLAPALAELETVIGIDGPSGNHPGYEELIATAEELETEAEVEDDETTILMYTSGTTALPKGVMLTYHDFTAYVTANVELADGTPRGAALLCVPLYHIAGTTNMMTTLWTGRRLVLMPQFEPRTKRLTSIGRPLPDVEVRIVGEDGATLGSGEVGEICVRTPRVMKGYAGGTESPLRDGWLPTRDMGWRDEEGYLFIAGRKDDMIIRGGENIAPAEVEAILQSHPGVEEAAVVGLTDLEWGQRVAACVVLRPGETLTA